MRNLYLVALVALCIGVFSAFSPGQSMPSAPAMPPSHVLVGAWEATDDTVFLFRKDGTFHGYDFEHKEIWGNWVTLSPTRIGFQSLLHEGSYGPQYAIIDKDSKNSMDYIVTGSNAFIKAARIPVDKAEEKIEAVVTPQVHRPGEPAESPAPEEDNPSRLE